MLDREGLMQSTRGPRVVRKHDVIFLPPRLGHAISNTGLTDLVFLLVTSPVTDDAG